MRSDILDGKAAGAEGTVTPTGYSNAYAFRTNVENHLLEYLPEGSPSKPVVLFYDDQ